MSVQLSNPATLPLAVTLVITELEVGGAEKCLTNLALGLQEKGIRVTVISLGSRPVAPKDALVQRLEAAGIAPHFLNARSAWQAIPTYFRLKGLLKTLRPNVVQTFLFHANILGGTAAKGASVPHVLAGIRVAEPRRWRQRLEKWLSHRITRLVCVSESVARFCHQTCGMNPEKLVVIPNGIDLRPAAATPADFSPLGLSAERKVLLYVGRLDPQKGLDWLLTQAQEILTALPQHDLVLVGDGPQRASLEQQASAIPIQQHAGQRRIYFAGWRDDIPACLARASLLLLPSRWEGMPNVVLEAMAASKPVVVTQAEGVAELLGPLATEQMVPQGDAARFTQQVIQLAADEALANQLGSANYQRVAQHFSLAAMVAKYEQLYRNPLAMLAASAPKESD